MRRISLPLIFCVVNSGCAQENTNTPINAESLNTQTVQSSTREEFVLDKDDFVMHVKLANSGDFSSARKLYEHYSLGLNDTAEALPWMEIIAKSGDPNAMRSVAFDYRTLGGVHNCEKFRYWVATIVKSPNFDHDLRYAKHVESILDIEFKYCLQGKKWWGKELGNIIDVSIKILTENKDSE